MAELTSRRQRGDDRPLVDIMREPGSLRSEITPHSYRIYDEKRSDYVERPSWGDNGWDQLAAALSKFNPALDKFAAVRNAKLVEEYAAKGQEAMHRSKLDWKAFVEQNPEYQGVSPHFERGYKAAELNTKAQNYTSELQEFYTTSGLMNNTNPAEVQAGFDKFEQEWIAKNSPLLEGYDADLYAENFLKNVQSGRASLLSRYTSDRAKEHVLQAGAAFGENIATTFETIFTQTPNISNPSVMSAALDKGASYVMGLMDEMTASGMTYSQAAAVATDAVLNLAKAWGEDGFGDELLAVAGRIKTGTGTLGGRPEFKAQVKTLEKQWQTEARQKRSEWYENDYRRRQKEENDAKGKLNLLAASAIKDGRQLTIADALGAVGEKHAMLAAQYANTYNTQRQNPANWTPEQHRQFSELEHQAYTGQLSEGDALDLFVPFGAKANDLVDAARKFANDDDPETKAWKSEAYKYAVSELNERIALFYPENGQQDVKKNIQQEAERKLRSRTSAYVLDYMKKNNGVRPSNAHLDSFLEGAVDDLYSKYQTRNQRMPDRMGLDGSVEVPVTIERPSDEEARNGQYWLNRNALLFESSELSQIYNLYLNGNMGAVLQRIQKDYGLTPDHAKAFLRRQYELEGSPLSAKILDEMLK